MVEEPARPRLRPDVPVEEGSAHPEAQDEEQEAKDGGDVLRLEVEVWVVAVHRRHWNLLARVRYRDRAVEEGFL